ncbi:hypothetical protein E0F15_17830 [Frankia sp. B2]|uniref:hypothetical protein n=1 Tax=unclassified Frankia TaxID=2632575 RepID=UPI0006CA5900|nr:MULTISPECIES: hypothetical protein [unclassified Frankia]KPM52714.1 hypothetical protein ACG83_24845 [Frankia sp. R43]TFE26498.1 hypothetical protein E0F15_17830 [Frankia sp. B2]
MRTVDRHTGIAIDLPDRFPTGWTVVDHGEGFEVLRKTSPTVTVEINFTVGSGGEETDGEDHDPADIGIWFFLITDGGRRIPEARSEGWDTDLSDLLTYTERMIFGEVR